MRPQTPREKYEALKASLASSAMEVGVPMRDGIELAADVYLPPQADRPVPAIVLSTPYDKSNPLFFVPEAKMYQENGYAFVVHDVRGRGKSEGEFRALVHDGRDTYDVIEWAASQAWCTGDVGTTGGSYAGWSQWAAAFEHPPHLRCMISTAAAGRWMEELPFVNGCFQLYYPWWSYALRRRILEDPSRIDWHERLTRLPVESIVDGLGITGRTWHDFIEHDTLDDHWRSLRFDGRYDEIDLPVLHVAGWFDYEDQLGAFHHYESAIRDGSDPTMHRLIVGPWSHVETRRPGNAYGGLKFGDAAAIDMDRIHLAFFDRHLTGRDEADDLPPATLFVTGANTWRTAEYWPLATDELVLHLDVGETGLLECQLGAPGALSYQYDPQNPAPSVDVDFGQMRIEPGLEQSSVEARDDVLTFTGSELERDLFVSGTPVVELFGSSDCEDTEWHVKLTDVDDGGSWRVGAGCRRASYRESLSEPSPITPGKVTPYRIELNPINHVFLAGHRIRLSVTSSDFPWFARGLNQCGPIGKLDDPQVATNTVHVGRGHASRIVLPVGE